MSANYTCNGSLTGCESARFGGCDYHDKKPLRDTIWDVRELVEAALGRSFLVECDESGDDLTFIEVKHPKRGVVLKITAELRDP